jgi:hypothetical protein
MKTHAHKSSLAVAPRLAQHSVEIVSNRQFSIGSPIAPLLVHRNRQSPVLSQNVRTMERRLKNVSSTTQSTQTLLLFGYTIEQTSFNRTLHMWPPKPVSPHPLSTYSKKKSCDSIFSKIHNMRGWIRPPRHFSALRILQLDSSQPGHSHFLSVPFRHEDVHLPHRARRSGDGSRRAA